MAIFKSKERIQHGTEIEDNTEKYDQYEAEAEATETEEEEQPHETEETESIPTEAMPPTSFVKAKPAPAVSAPAMVHQPAASAPKDKISDTRVYLTTKLDRDLHARVKIYSYKAHKSIAAVLEELIAQHIPEI